MHVPTLCDWLSSYVSDCDSDNLVISAVFTRSYYMLYASDSDSDSVATDNQPQVPT